MADHWYDYLNPVYDYNEFYKKPADAKKAGLDQLTTQLQSLANQQRDFQLQA